MRAFIIVLIGVLGSFGVSPDARAADEEQRSNKSTTLYSVAAVTGDLQPAIPDGKARKARQRSVKFYGANW